MGFIIDKQTEKTNARKIKYFSGDVAKYLNWDYKNFSVQEAERMTDARMDKIEKPQDDNTEISRGEYNASKRDWLMACLLGDAYLDDTKGSKGLVKWDVFMGDDVKKPIEINQTHLEAVLSEGDLFHPIYDDFVDLTTRIADGQSLSDKQAEIKNLMKSAGRGKS